MKIHFLGANRQVTGSRYCLEVNEHKILIDCGLFQERSFVSRNWVPNPIPEDELDAMLLTHVHIDHSGLIPRLVKHGFQGPIYCTRPSVELAEVLLRDSAKIQMEDAEYKKRRHQREGRQPKATEQPLYTTEDVEQTLPLLKATPYTKEVEVTKDVTAVFHDAGHILGSSMLEITATEGQMKRKIIFSGDIGQWSKPLIRDPTLFEQADYVVMESTYGDRDHAEGGDIAEQLQTVINDTVGRGGNVVIPTFAVERAQEVMYHISELVHADRIPDVKVFLDSPMAVDVTDIFHRYRDCFDQETWLRIIEGQAPLRFPGLHMSRSVDESKQINRERMPCVIMATSGMCTAGRIKHHLRLNVSRHESTVLFVGYQGRGTLGRQILDKDKEVRIHGRMYPVRAQVAQIYGFSGHADRTDLLKWIGAIHRPRKVFLTHGDEDAATNLAAAITKQMNTVVHVPDYHETIDLD